MEKIYIAIIAGVFGAFFSAFFSNRKERNILIEKWMNQLRNEVSLFLGKCEQLRLLNIEKDNFDVSNSIYGEIISSTYRIELLLDKKKDDKKNDQKKLIDETQKFRKFADEEKYKDFIQTEKVIVETTVNILDYHWKQISLEMKHTLLVTSIKKVIQDFGKKNKKR